MSRLGVYIQDQVYNVYAIAKEAARPRERQAKMGRVGSTPRTKAFLSVRERAENEEAGEGARKRGSVPTRCLVGLNERREQGGPPPRCRYGHTPAR